MSDNKQSDVSRIIERLKRESEENGSKSISESESKKMSLKGMAHIGNAMPSFRKVDDLPIPTLTEITSDETKRIMQQTGMLYKSEHDHAQAKVELTFINAAIALAEGSNDIGAEVTIAGITVGVSVNSRLVPILKAEASEIERYLNGLPNNYE